MIRILILIICFFCCGCRKEKIEFPHGYIWRATSPNQSEIISPSGQVLLSGFLCLWGKYPFVYGNGDRNNREFVLNLKTGDLIFFNSAQDFSFFLEKKKLPVFYTLKTDLHQTTIVNIFHQHDSKSEEFLKNIRLR